MSTRHQVSDITKRRFICLIRKSISGCDIDDELFGHIDNNGWNELIFLSRVQTVEAIVFDEILKLDTAYLPPQNICLYMFKEIERVKAQNSIINTVLSKLSYNYNKLGFDFLFFKGPICAMNYPYPNLRCIGDLDVFLHKKEDFKAANLWAVNSGFKYYKDELKLGHWSFVYDDILIENHNNITFFENKKYNRIFEKLIQSVLDNNDYYRVTIGGEEIKTLPIELNYIYIFLHLFYHFVHGGIGFRQYMDWIYWTITYNKDIDRDHFIDLCNIFDISYPIGLFARVAVDYLSIDEHIFPFNVVEPSEDAKLIINDMLDCGNFGILHTDYWKGRWRGRLHKFIKTIRRAIKLYHISPEYSSYVPLHSLYSRIYLTFKGK